jgi:hydrogen peroxide-dependent heme synthase
MSAISPATLEGWYALHQIVSVDWAAVADLGSDERGGLERAAQTLFQGLAKPESGGWSAVFQVVGGGADLMLVHFRETLDELGAVEARVRRSEVGRLVETVYDYLSVTEAGMYHATAEAAREAKPGSKEFERLLAEQVEAERATPHLQVRLYPQVPEGMRYVSFYPMNKRRDAGQNWYSLPLEERNRLMREHGLTGRRYAGRVFQIITGSIGFDDWEWGVTLFARDPLEFKRIVTEMRYDEASAVYGEFGSFFTGVRLEPEAAAEFIAKPDRGA